MWTPFAALRRHAYKRGYRVGFEAGKVSAADTIRRQQGQVTHALQERDKYYDAHQWLQTEVSSLERELHTAATELEKETNEKDKLLRTLDEVRTIPNTNIPQDVYWISEDKYQLHDNPREDPKDGR